MLARILETEVMDSRAEAVDYDAMDHAAVNRAFVADLLAAARDAACDLGRPGATVLDLGAGTAQIPIELCRQAPGVQVVALDAAAEMLAVARRNVAQATLADRIRLQQADAKRLPYADGQFAAVISNSIVHHLPEPAGALAEAYRVTAPGGLIFFRDLFRPDDEPTLRRLVETYAAGANDHQRQMFADSLRAALTVAEVCAMVGSLPGRGKSVCPTSDRHWTWTMTKGEERPRDV
jgi:ubiquinone/menaquinone biosynthesis C-methylase UbiE